MATVKTLIGNVKGPQGDKGDQGLQGEKGVKGDTGQRGSRWVSGGAITGTSTTDTVFSGTGITDALVNDQYLNPRTGHVYRCTKAGDADTATWVWTGNINDSKTVGIQTDEGVGTWKAGGGIGPNVLMDVCYGKGKFVAIIGDESASNGCFYSEDGVIWYFADMGGVDTDMKSVVSGDWGFVAVDAAGTTYHSEDGVTWHIAGGIGIPFEDITYGNVDDVDILVAVGGNGTYVGHIEWSMDATTTPTGGTVITNTTKVTWDAYDGINISDSLYGVTYGNGTFVAVGCKSDNRRGAVYTSTDGEVWVCRKQQNFAGNVLLDVTYGNGMFVAIGRNEYGDRDLIYYSTDGATWTLAMGNTFTLQSSTALHYGCITYGNGAFVAVNNEGKTIYTSLDGITWDSSSAPGSNRLFGVACGDGTFVAVGYGSVYYAGHAKDIRNLEEVINEHEETINEHEETINEHGEIINEHDKTINDHGEIINEHDKTINEHDKTINELDNNKLDSSYAKQLFVQNDSSGKHSLHLYWDEKGLCAKVDVTDLGALAFKSNLSDLETLIRRLNTAVYELQSVNNTVTSGIILYNVKTNVAQDDRLRKQGRIVQISSMFVPSEDIQADTTFATLPAVFKPCMDTPIVVTRAATVEAYYCLICTDGSIKIPNISMPGGYYYNIYATFISAI